MIGTESYKGKSRQNNAKRQEMGAPAKSERAAEAQKAEDQLLAELGELFKDERETKWEIGDRIIQLKEHFGWTTARLADHFTQERNRLDEYVATCRAFPPKARRSDLSFYRHESARKAAKAVARSVSQELGEEQEPNYAEALDYLTKRDEAAKRSGDERIQDVRSMSSALVHREREKIAPILIADSIRKQLINTELFGCHHSDFRNIVSRLADSSVMLAHLDPPYANYTKTADGRLDTSTSVALTDCDNQTEPEAIAATVDAVRALAPKLERGGVILLWQAATGIRAEIGRAIEECGLAYVPTLIWDKGRPQPGAFNSPLMFSTEFCYVLKRKGDGLVNHDPDTSRAQILSSQEFPPIMQRAASIEQFHMFQKPENLSEFLIRKFSNEGSICVDLFGCSGSFCIAAARLGRKWVYCESNANNYEFGSSRILRAVQTLAANDAAAA